MLRILTIWMALGLICCAAAGQTREQKVRGDKAKVEADGFWIYNDLAKGYAEAKKTGRPMVVALRCIPCEQCVKLDDDLVEKDERIKPLLEKFVRVRVISANGLDLSLFQFDTDQSFAVFMLNADGTIFGRFGTRSDQRNWTDASYKTYVRPLALPWPYTLAAGSRLEQSVSLTLSGSTATKASSDNRIALKIGVIRNTIDSSQSSCLPRASSRSRICADSLPSTSPACTLACTCTRSLPLAFTAAGLASCSPFPTTAIGIARPSVVVP